MTQQQSTSLQFGYRDIMMVIATNKRNNMACLSACLPACHLQAGSCKTNPSSASLHRRFRSGLCIPSLQCHNPAARQPPKPPFQSPNPRRIRSASEKQRKGVRPGRKCVCKTEEPLPKNGNTEQEPVQTAPRSLCLRASQSPSISSSRYRLVVSNYPRYSRRSNSPS